jgi:acetolactate synthase-1/2/3 large subunit
LSFLLREYIDTQRNFFNGIEVGASPKSGVSFPNFSKVASAFDIPFVRIKSIDDIDNTISNFLNLDGPAICEVLVDENQAFAPKLSAKKLPDGTIVSPPLEDLSPFLSKEELKRNLIG